MKLDWRQLTCRNAIGWVKICICDSHNNCVIDCIYWWPATISIFRSFFFYFDTIYSCGKQKPQLLIYYYMLWMGLYVLVFDLIEVFFSPSTQHIPLVWNVWLFFRLCVWVRNRNVNSFSSHTQFIAWKSVRDVWHASGNATYRCDCRWPDSMDTWNVVRYANDNDASDWSLLCHTIDIATLCPDRVTAWTYCDKTWHDDY